MAARDEDSLALRKKYDDAAEQLRISQRKESRLLEEKAAVTRSISEYSAEKISFEDRLEAIKHLIAVLTGALSGRSLNIPEVIDDAGQSVNAAEESFYRSIKCDDVAPASLSEAFRPPSVTEQPDSAEALEVFRKEAERLGENIENIKARIRQLESRSDVIRSQINMCISAQDAIRRDIRAAIAQMNGRW